MTRRSPTGFTLVELLVVIAIITLLVGGLLLSLTGTSGAAKLSTAGSRVTGWIEAARETAILKRQPVAVVMLVSGDAVANRVLTALSYVPPASAGGVGQWTQSAPWESLPEGVLIDAGLGTTGDTALSPAGSPVVSPALPTLIYRNVSYPARSASGYGYMIFLPDGSLYQDTAGSLPTPCLLRLVEGVVQGATIRYGSPTSGGLTADYFEISLNQPTGQAKIIRP